MKLIVTILLVSLSAGVLSGCSSPASRMAECQAQNISRDTCYQAEQTRQAAILNASMSAAYANQRKAVKQHAQSAKKVQRWQGFDVEVKRDSLGIVTVNGKPAAQDEVAPKATVYSQGLFKVIFYTSGKVALLKEGVFIGYLH